LQGEWRLHTTRRINFSLARLKQGQKIRSQTAGFFSKNRRGTTNFAAGEREKGILNRREKTKKKKACSESQKRPVGGKRSRKEN